MKKIKHSFGCYKNAKGETIGKVKDIAKALVNWGNIPPRLNNLRAQEISMVARDYLELLKSENKKMKPSEGGE